MVLASGFVVDRQKGIFMTAKHFTDAVEGSGSDSFKLFTNGMAYDAYVMKVPPLRDAALVRLEGKFDPKDISAPYHLASVPLKKGDTVFFQGMHPHPCPVRNSNAADGFPDIIVPILKDYYGIMMRDCLHESEIVFDDLESNVVDLNSHILLNAAEKDAKLGRILYDANFYYRLKTKRNHKFSFGGLSGGPALNAKRELVGLNTAEEAARFKFTPEPQKEKNSSAGIKIEKVEDTLFITPIGTVQDLFDYAKSVK